MFFVSAMMILFVLMVCSGCAEAAEETVTKEIEIMADKPRAVLKSEATEVLLLENASGMHKFGHLYFDMPADVFLTYFELGDIVTVTVDGCEALDVPVCASYDDVSSGEPLLRAQPGKDSIILAINYGQIGITLDVLEETGNDVGDRYEIQGRIKLPLRMTVSLKEKAGYKDKLVLSNLTRPNDRNEYGVLLSDEQFANFRAINTTGIRNNTLYRSSSPIDDTLGRNTVADALAEKAGIHTFINLADSEDKAVAFRDFSSSYYSGQNVIYCNLPTAFTIQTFSDGFADGLRYMITHEGPYLIHCSEGKDRAGFAAAVLELFMGASIEEVKNDYLTTYENYFAELKDGGIQLNDDLREFIGGLIISNLELAFGIDDIASVDTKKVTEDYLLSIGLSAEELAALAAAITE